MKVGDKLKAFREHFEFNQKEFAGLLGIDQSGLSKIERNVSLPSYEACLAYLRVAEKLKYKLNLFDLEDDK